MFAGIKWNKWSEDHIARHNVKAEEVDAALFSGEYPYHVYREGNLFHFLAKTEAGRYLFILGKLIQRAKLFIITARDMDDKERRAYKRATRRRPRQ